MFGIDLGLTISSVTLIDMKDKLIDHFIIFGDTSDRDYWKRITNMSQYLTDSIINITKANSNIFIDPLVAIETPVFPWRTKNPQAYANTQALYAVTRYKLEARGFTVYDVNPTAVKAAARKTFKGMPKSKYVEGRNKKLNKMGMIRAFFKVHGREPDYHTKAGRETLADSFFIAKAGIAKRRIEKNANTS